MVGTTPLQYVNLHEPTRKKTRKNGIDRYYLITYLEEAWLGYSCPDPGAAPPHPHWWL